MTTKSRRVYPHDIKLGRDVLEYLLLRRELAAPEEFTQDDVAYSVKIPHSEVSRVLNYVMVPLGIVRQSRTDGARKFYTLAI